jgi:hypothetical protein
MDEPHNTHKLQLASQFLLMRQKLRRGLWVGVALGLICVAVALLTWSESAIAGTLMGLFGIGLLGGVVWSLKKPSSSAFLAQSGCEFVLGAWCICWLVFHAVSGNIGLGVGFSAIGTVLFVSRGALRIQYYRRFRGIPCSPPAMEVADAVRSLGEEVDSADGKMDEFIVYLDEGPTTWKARLAGSYAVFLGLGGDIPTYKPQTEVLVISKEDISYQVLRSPTPETAGRIRMRLGRHSFKAMMDYTSLVRLRQWQQPIGGLGTS